jgi:hypothetical protein
MSNRYKGGVISATPPTTTGGESGTASGAWTLEQQMQLQAAGLWPLQPTGPYIEEVFSTYLYTGNAGTQTVTNGIDLSTKGGMVWIKSRSGAFSHSILDTVRGFNYSATQTRRLNPASTDNEADEAGNATQASPLADGFSVTTSGGGAINIYNGSGSTYVSWTFRKQPKFFDVVTYTGTGAVQNIAHNLGSVPGCIIVKSTSASGYWPVYHQSLGNTKYVELNTTNQALTNANYWNSTTPTSTQFTVGTSADPNANGVTYVAYLFAHNAGGFGLTGADNVISCGSFTTDGSGNATVNLGYEPQWMLLKNVNEGSANWGLFDTLRGWTTDTGYQVLTANTSSAEGSNPTSYYAPTSTGIKITSASVSQTQIYIAIRRGPMRVPTVGTSVYNANIFPANSATNNTVINPGFPVDLVFMKPDKTGDYNWYWQDRLRGQKYLYSNATNAEVNSSTAFDYSNGYVQTLTNGTDGIGWSFRRAPSFFDEVCYTVSGFAANDVAHNLTVTPELFITKPRGSIGGWTVYGSVVGSTNNYMTLNDTQALQTSGSTVWGATSSTFSNPSTAKNGTHVCYLFATCAGVSKVGSYTGTGAAQTINCGFTAGSRFVMIKRTDSTGDWYVWDSARGIIPSNDPYLLINSTAAEVTGTDYVDTTNVGFDITSTAPAAINANGGTFIFLAIA